MNSAIGNKAVLLIGLFIAFAPAGMQAQTFLWGDQFEYPAGVNSPTSGTKTPTLEGGGGTDAGESVHAYFGRCFMESGDWVIRDATEIPTVLEPVSFGAYSSWSLNGFWAGEQHNDIPNNTLTELQIEWTGIPIAGYSELQFRGLFAASASLEPGEDYLILEYKINGLGNYATGLELKRTSGEGPWSVNGAGQIVIDKTFQTVSFAIDGTGNTLDLRMRVSVDDQGDEWAVDRFELYSCSALAPVISVQETSGLVNHDGVVCSGGEVTLSVGNFTTYAWSTGAATQSISENPLSNTTYSVTVTQGGCFATAEKQISVNPNPVADIAVLESSAGTDNDGIICGGASVILNAGTFNSYNWSPGGEISNLIVVNPLVTTEYSVTVTDALACRDVDSQTVTISAPQAYPLTTTDGDGPFCADGTPRTMRMSDSDLGVAYQLLLDGVIIGNPIPGTGAAANFSPPQNAPGVYTVRATTASTGCIALMDGSVTLVDPDVAVDAGPDLATCEDQEVTLNGSTGATGDIEWSASVAGGNFDPDNGTLSAGYTPPPDFSGTIFLTLAANNPAPCPQVEDALVLTVHPSPTAVISITENSAGSENDGVICSGTSITLDAGTFPSYSWSPGGGTTPSITETPDASAIYSVTITDENGCENSDNVSITVRPTPQISPLADTTVLDGDIVSFVIDAAPVPLDLFWELEIINIVESPTDFELEGATPFVEARFTVENKRAAGEALYTILAEKDGCLDTATALVRVFPLEEGATGEDLLFIPELLTPDGDGVNDEWTILLPGGRLPEEFSVIIRNRAGRTIHEGTLAERFDPSICPNGVYFYVVKDGQTGAVFKGAITIITTH